MTNQISESELILMRIIWKSGGAALYSLIMDELDKDKNEWKNNTVLTLLSRLIEKGYLKVKKIGMPMSTTPIKRRQRRSLRKSRGLISRS